MTKRQYAPLTPEQLKALRSYAAYAGSDWKLGLLAAWRNASMPGHLHALRNSHGPSWLAQFKLEAK